VPDVSGDVEKPPEVSGRIGLCGGIVPRARPVLCSGVAGGKPGFVGIVGAVCVAPPMPFVGAVMMESAAMTHVPDNIINPTTVKPMEVSFIGISCIVSWMGAGRGPWTGHRRGRSPRG